MTAIAATADVPEKAGKHFPPPTAKTLSKRGIFNKVIELGESIPASHIVLWAWIALYYIAFQWLHGQHLAIFGGITLPDVKGYWDTLFSRHIRLLSQDNWDTWRHFFRDGGEAYLVTMTVLFLTFNPYAQKRSIDKIDGVWEIIGRVLLTLLAAIPVMILCGFLFHEIQHWFHTGTLAPALGAHPNWAQKMYASSWTTKVSVIIAGIVCRRMMYPVFSFAQEYFAERRVANGKHDHWFQPAPFRARVRAMYAAPGASIKRAQKRQGERDNIVVWFMSGGLVLLLILGAYGFYIQNWIAK